MRSVRLTLVALWWRRWLSVAVLAVAVITTGSAALGPFFARAAGESVLRDTIASAPAQDSGAELSSTGDLTTTTPAALRSSLTDGRIPASYGTPVGTQQISVTLLRDGDSSAQTVAATLAARDAVCAHLQLTAGSECPAGAGDILVSVRTAKSVGWAVGQVIRETSVEQAFIQSSQTSAVPLATLRVTGTYQVPDPSRPYWFGRNIAVAQRSNGDGPDTIDTVFTTPATLAESGGYAQTSAFLDLPLNQRAVHAAGLGRLHGDLATVQRIGTTSISSGPAVTVVSRLDVLLTTASRDQSLLDVSVLAVTLQLAMLAWFVLYLLIAATTDARAGEIALARLHGHSPRSTLSFGLLEPVLLLVVAAPLGLLAADLATRLLSASLLASGTQVHLRLPPVWGALAALLGGLVAAALAAHKALTRPVLEQWQRAGGDGAARRAGTLVDGVVVALAAAGVVQLVTGGTHQGGRSDVVALAAPALLTLALSVLAVRLLPRLSLPALHRSRASAAVPRFLAYRQLVRRPSMLRLITLLALATSLATFAVDATAIAAHNRAARAGYDVGADRVVEVGGVSPQQLLVITHRLDPTGRQAMAVVRSTAFADPDDRTGTLLAVDSPRLGAVATWRHDLAGVSAATLGSRLHPTVPAPVLLPPGRLSVTLSTAALHSSVAITVVADVAGANGSDGSQVRLGRLLPGRHVYTGALPSCADRCRLTGLAFAQPLGSFTEIAATVTVSAVSGGDARLGTDGVWQAASTGADRSDLTRAGDALTFAFRSSSGEPPAIVVRDVPQPLPAVFGASSAGSGPPDRIRDLADTPVAAAGVAVSAGIPGAGPSATMVDLTYALRDSGSQPTGSLEVWLSRSAPQDFPQRLAAAGVQVSATLSTAGRLHALNRSGPALSLLLFLLVAGTATVIAAGATAVTIYLGARRRTFEIAAMHAVGVTRRQLFAAAVREQLLLLAVGVGVGLLGGLVGATLAMPTVPQFTDQTDVPAVQLMPHPVPLLLLIAVLIVAVGVTVVSAARLMVRAARPSRLREAAP